MNRLSPLVLLCLLPVLGGCVLGRVPENKGPAPAWTTSPNGEPLPFRAGQDDCRAALAAWFDGADRNGDGTIDTDETVADAARWFAIADLNRDGQITADELTTVRARLLPHPPPGAEAEQAAPAPGRRGPALRSQARVDTVMQADANADFRVSAEEFSAFAVERLAGRGLSRAQVLDGCGRDRP